MAANIVNDPTISTVEGWIKGRGYSISKKYDGVKGICTVTLTSKNSHTIITDANRGRADLGSAYKSALLFAFNQIKSLEAAK
jgi:hypothetical protein